MERLEKDQGNQVMTADALIICMRRFFPFIISPSRGRAGTYLDPGTLIL